ncbi:MAG TPA: hypothetical protein VH080_07485 [Gemmatimonadaceae bacterium]|nr:hypothetical protein [Gemmatimonadaceae bacterium]
MNDTSIAATLATLFGELINGAPRDPSYMLNTGDAGLLGSLDKISASDASRIHAGGASIAAHVDHLRYGLSLMNQWRSGVANPWARADWTMSWRKTSVSNDEWKQLRTGLRDETHQWLDTLGAARELDETQLTYMMASIAHLAYHLGAIRQMDRVIRGPSAEEEVATKLASVRS